ncbi:MAG TPA: oxygenase MpaB family protein [Ktedonobacteraceae bacterium]
MGQLAIGLQTRTAAPEPANRRRRARSRRLLRLPLWMIVRLITVGQLPSDIRQAYGLRWTMRQRAGFRIARGVGHLLRRLFPNALGRPPLVNFARRRVQGELCRPTEPVLP